MFKERIQEVFEFTQSESPYRKANKGWINPDIFLDLSPTNDKVSQENEAAQVILFWSPINNLISNIFIIIIACSIIVFTSVSFVKGRFDFNYFSNSVIVDVAMDEGNKSLNISDSKDIEPAELTDQKDFEIVDLEKSSKIVSLDDNLRKEIQINKDIKILQNKKSKSNFI